MRGMNDDQLSPTQLAETKQESPKKSKFTYSRELLLSLSELDICSKLPSGFDPSILSEFEEASNNIPERSRIPGSLSSQNFRRGEYGSSPPTKGDLGNSSRGHHGRWDTRSSGSNDRDSDPQLDAESDSGWRIVNHSRRPRQNLEHDGLLGSGSFPKPSGFASASVTTVRGSGQYQLNRTQEPYQPPRPYKAGPHSRRDATDVINEETFGSSESSSQDREEEERKRRASFEQFRKEQKALQEKQKQFPDKHKENVDPGMAALLGNSEDDKKIWDKPIISQGNSVKSSFAAQTSASRPLVPPGFLGATLEKNLGTKTSSHSTLEIGNGGDDENSTQSKRSVVANGTSDKLVDEKPLSNIDTSKKQYGTVHTSFADISEKSLVLSSDGALNENFVGVVSSSMNSSISKMDGGQRNNDGTEFYAEKILVHADADIASQQDSTSILTKLFGKVSIADSGVSGFLEPGDVNADKGSPIPYQSSKFSHWFLEEAEKRPEDDPSSAKPEDLLSLIVNGEKDGYQVPKISDKKPSAFPFGSSDLIDKSVVTSSCTIATIEPPFQSSNAGGSQGVLTCEDLEQSILSEFSDNSSSADHTFPSWSVVDAKVEKKPEVDSQASQHLLSLLQKGSSMKDPAQHPIQEASENFFSYETGSANSVRSASKGDAEKVAKSENNLTLETLFGTAFMKELQSVKAPVSVQRGSVGENVLDSQGFPFPVPDDGFSPRTSNRSFHEDDSHVLNHAQQNNPIKTEEPCLQFDDFQSNIGSKLSTIRVIDRPDEDLENQLPDEESLIAPFDPVDSQHAIVARDARQADLLPSVDIVDKLAALNAVYKRERSTIPGFDDSSFLRGPHNPVEPELPYQSQHEQSTSHFPHLQMNHGRPLFQPSDTHPSHMNPSLRMMGPENTIHPDYSRHPFPANIMHPSSFQHVPNGPTRFSPPAHHPMLQQMHLQGNLIPPHLARGLPRGGPMPPYTYNHMSGYVPEPNQMQNHPFGRHQSNYSGLELPMQAHAIGSGGNNHPETLEKLIEMELRANLKQMHPAAGAAHNLATHGHGRYR